LVHLLYKCFALNNTFMKTLVKILPLLLLATLLSCKKDKKDDPEPTPTPTGSLKLHLENMVDTNDLVFGANCVNAMGDTFKISKFNYYISNIVITKTDNSTFAESNSYHLVRHSSTATSLINVANVPVGSYKSVSFMIGIDSTRNVSGTQSGDLDPVVATDMFWTWNSGYIFVKLEGTSPKSGASDKSIVYHIGGGGGANKAQRTVNLTFGTSTANVSETETPIIHISVDALEMLKTPNTINFATDYNQMTSGPGAKKYADNYADMFHFEHIHN
jgi:hypothetical protein